MSAINIDDIRRDPAEFLRRLQAGEALTIVSDERTLAEVKPVPPPRTEPRPFGLAAGAIRVPADFDDPLPEDILRDFECR